MLKNSLNFKPIIVLATEHYSIFTKYFFSKNGTVVILLCEQNPHSSQDQKLRASVVSDSSA